ncbi:hypothetical protein [Corynebacterium accolens]|uniref:phage terminase small subunit n=1 Tax=Corynebacterium accolens TaxID=38284 RepID=UPI0025430736|nr:hypothetical protein [Corynebacterium accolens]MDK4338304.1 hypothetical protein [Corynebacterium accolens]
MAGRGPAPKPEGRRARRNKDEHQVTILRFEQCEQPPLPELPGGEQWCEQTLNWWEMWRQSPQAELFTVTDWDFLKDTALVHHAVWGYMNLSKLQELRVRVAKFGATMEDRARLRIQFAEADEADNRRPNRVKSARERRGDLKVVDFKKETS